MESARTPAKFIEGKIKAAFSELAENAATMELTEDEAAGLPITLFAAENYLLNCWKAYTADDAQGQ